MLRVDLVVVVGLKARKTVVASVITDVGANSMRLEVVQVDDRRRQRPVPGIEDGSNDVAREYVLRVRRPKRHASQQDSHCNWNLPMLAPTLPER